MKSSVQVRSSVLCDPMDCSMPGISILHQFLELAQTHVLQIGDVIQPSCPLLSPSPPAFSPSQHRGIFLIKRWEKYPGVRFYCWVEWCHPETGNTVFLYNCLGWDDHAFMWGCIEAKLTWRSSSGDGKQAVDVQVKIPLRDRNGPVSLEDVLWCSIIKYMPHNYFPVFTIHGGKS